VNSGRLIGVFFHALDSMLSVLRETSNRVAKGQHVQLYNVHVQYTYCTVQ
jgi:hypothetical protein